MSAVSWWGYGIASAILLVILAGLFVIGRAMFDDSGRYSEVKDMMESLFHTPSFLRPGSGEESSGAPAQTARRDGLEPFEDHCPGCREKVTHEHAECPSCGLRLLD